MTDNKEAFWTALGALTFAETVEIAAVFRDAHDCTTDFEPTDAADWSFLLNTAREIAEGQLESAA